MFNPSKGKILYYITLVVFAFTQGVYCHSRPTHDSDSSEGSKTSADLRIKYMIDNYYNGKQTFKKYCIQCHVAPEKPGHWENNMDNLLYNLPSPTEDYFTRFVRNSPLLKSSGDKYAQDLENEFKPGYEHFFQDSLSIQDINNLITYIKVAVKHKHDHGKTGGNP